MIALTPRGKKDKASAAAKKNGDLSKWSWDTRTDGRLEIHTR